MGAMLRVARAAVMRCMQGRLSRTLAVGGLVLVLALVLGACSSSDDEKVADLEQQVSHLESQLEDTQSKLQDAEDRNAELQDQLSTTQGQLQAQKKQTKAANEQLAQTQEQLAATEAALIDASNQLNAVKSLRLPDGSYVGPVLGAKSTPNPIIVFNQGGSYFVGLVASGVKITAGGSEYTLSQFGKLLASKNPDDANLAQGNYKVIVKNGVVTSIRKSSA